MRSLRRNHRTVLLLAMVLFCSIVGFCEDIKKDNRVNEKTVRPERMLIKKGNEAYRKGNVKDAEVFYTKALQANPSSCLSKYNLAMSLLKQTQQGDKLDQQDGPLAKSVSLMKEAASTAQDKNFAARIYYNLGNVYYNNEKYQESIENYKACLRRTPNDEHARQNLRLAQKKLQQQNQNQDNKDNKQDQQKPQQNQNQQDKQEPQKQDNKQDDQQQQQQPQPQPQGNQEQMLKAVEDKEKDTQQRVNARMDKDDKRNRRNTEHEW